MILLRRLGQDEGFFLNPDLVFTVEGNPDTTISLTTGLKLVVVESVEEVVAAIRAWRSDVAAQALVKGRASRALAAK